MTRLFKQEIVNPVEFFRQSVLKSADKTHLIYVRTDKITRGEEVDNSTNIPVKVPDSVSSSVPDLFHHHIENFSLLDSWQRVYQLRQDLKQQGIAPGDRVGICLENSPLHLWLHLACASIGAITLLLPHRASTQELEVILKDAQVSLVYIASEEKRFTDFSFPTATYDLEQSIKSEIREQSLTALQRPVSPPPANTIAALLYTSGSSGRPKGVGLTHENLHYGSLNFRAGFNYQADQGVSGVCAPLSHIGGFNGTTLDRFLHGGQVVIFSSFVPETVLYYLEKYQINMMFLVPTMAWALISCPHWEASDLSAFTQPLIGGAVLSQELCEMLTRKHLSPIHVWGMTELAGSGTCVSTAKLLGHNDSSFASTSNVPIGYAFPYNQITLRAFTENDSNLAVKNHIAELRPRTTQNYNTEQQHIEGSFSALKPQKDSTPSNSPSLPIDTTIGELAVKGPAVFHGYWHEAQLFKSSSGYQIKPREDYFLTGDLASQTEEELYCIQGRKNRLFKSGGEFISPELLEEKLAAHPLVKAVAAYGVNHSYWGEALYVTLVLQENAESAFYAQLCVQNPDNTCVNINADRINSHALSHLESASSNPGQSISTEPVEDNQLEAKQIETEPIKISMLTSRPAENTLDIAEQIKGSLSEIQPNQKFFRQYLEKLFKDYLLAQGLPAWKLPKGYFYRDALPLNGNGKISYQVLQMEATALLAQEQ